MSSVYIRFVLLLVQAIYISETQATLQVNRFIQFKNTVHKINGFKNNDYPLVIHCNSKDDDLGEHSLAVNEEFKFHFNVAMFGYTHFWCNMKRGTDKNRTIDVFYEGEYILCNDTGNCFWKPTETGIFFNNDNSTNWAERYYW